MSVLKLAHVNTTGGANIAVFTGTGMFYGLVANHSGGAGTVLVYDSVAANAAAIIGHAEVTAPASPVVQAFPVECTAGLCATGSGAVDYIVFYKT